MRSVVARAKVGKMVANEEMTVGVDVLGFIS